MFFNGWFNIFRTLVVGVLAYVSLVLILRITGKRTLSKMNAFDLVVTIALGSTLATILLSKDVALLEGIAAWLVLIGMQFLITSLTLRSDRFAALIKAEPSLLFYEGQFLRAMQKKERVTSTEIEAAVRAEGIGSLKEVTAVILETDGSFTVIPAADRPDISALDHVSGKEHTD